MPLNLKNPNAVTGDKLDPVMQKLVNDWAPTLNRWSLKIENRLDDAHKKAAQAPTVAKSVATTVVANTPSSGGAVSLSMPPEFIVAGSPGNALVVTKAPEPPNTAWAAPTSSLPGLEAQTSGSAGPANLGAIPLTLAANPSTPTSWGLYTYFTNAGTSPTPAGWTVQGSTPVFTKSFTGLSTVSVTETVTLGNTGGLAALFLFAGTLPTFIQNATGGFGFSGGGQTLPFSISNTAGNTLLMVITAQGDNLGNTCSLSASDSNGNSYVPIANTVRGGDITNIHGNNQGLSQMVLMASNCVAGANTVTWNVSGPQGPPRAASIYIFEIGPITAGPGVPFFRQLNGGDFTGFDAGKIISGLVPLSHGGTGADLSATGGASQVLKQNAVGAPITVGQLGYTNLSGSVATVANVQNGFASASLGPTTLYSANGNFLYEITYNLVTVSAGTGGTVTLTLTWNNGAAQTFTTPTVALATLGNYTSGSLILKSTGTPQWATTVTGALGGPFYGIDIRVVPLG